MKKVVVFFSLVFSFAFITSCSSFKKSTPEYIQQELRYEYVLENLDYVMYAEYRTNTSEKYVVHEEVKEILKNLSLTEINNPQNELHVDYETSLYFYFPYDDAYSLQFMDHGIAEICVMPDLSPSYSAYYSYDKETFSHLIELVLQAEEYKR